MSSQTVARVVILVVVSTLAGAPSVSAQSGACGGDDPSWLLVTRTGGDRDASQSSDQELTQERGRPWFIRVCNIHDMAWANTGGTLIFLKSTRDADLPADDDSGRAYVVVAKSPSQICAAMATCRDATRSN